MLIAGNRTCSSALFRNPSLLLDNHGKLNDLTTAQHANGQGMAYLQLGEMAT